MQAGIGMAETLRMAEEKRAHTLTDRGTYLRFRSQLSLVILSEGDALLWNPYSVICVSSKSHPQVNEAAAQELVKFLLSAETQKLIGEFGVSEVGQPLFIPDAIPLR